MDNIRLGEYQVTHPEEFNKKSMSKTEASKKNKIGLTDHIAVIFNKLKAKPVSNNDIDDVQNKFRQVFVEYQSGTSFTEMAARQDKWIPVDRIKPVGSVLLKTTSGLVVIGDLYDGKWRVDGHWRHVGEKWVSDYKFDDIISWRRIPI